MFTSKIYKLSPIIIQNILLSSRGFLRKKLRENKLQKAISDEINRNEYDNVILTNFSNEMLTRALDNAKTKAPFYSHRDEIDTGNLKSFPFISKTNLREEPEGFLCPDYNGIIIKGTTSGTTGTPLTIKQNMTSIIREQAFIARNLEWAGFKEGDKRAWIRGDMVVPFEQKKAPFWRHSWFENMILLSSFHMSNNVLSDYITAMVDYGVNIIQAYPSSILTLAKYLDVKDEYYPAKLKSIITSSESLSADDKQLIEKRFNCTVFDWYGLFERVAAIASCEHGRYHILTDYSHVELIDTGNGRHEIVGTNFNNSLYPLIQYKTGDHVVLSDEESCPCGRVFPLIDHIEGRVGDYLIGEDGQKIHILNHIPKGVRGLIACQFVQKSLTYIQILAVVEDKLFTAEQKALLIANTKERVGKSIDVDIGIVTQLSRTKSGKVRQAVREIN